MCWRLFLEDDCFSKKLLPLFPFLIGVLRFFEELLLTNQQGETYISLFFDFWDSCSFYVFLFFSLYAFLRWFKLDKKKIFGVEGWVWLCVGFLLPLLPPLIDVMIYPKTEIYYFYPEPNIFFYEDGMTIGELSVGYFAIISFAVLSFILSSNPFFLLLGAFFIYASFHILSSGAYLILSTFSFPQSYFFIFSYRLLGVLLFFILSFPKFRALVLYRLSRYALILSLALAFSNFTGKGIFLSCLFIYVLSCIFFVEQKTDREEDEKNKRPYFNVGLASWWICEVLFLFIPSVGMSGIFVLISLSLMAVFYFLLRIKCYFPLNAICEGLAFSSIGFAFGLDILKCIVLFITFFIGALAKDYKDVKGDKSAGVKTLFTILDEKDVKRAWLIMRLILIFGPSLSIPLLFSFSPYLIPLFIAFFIVSFLILFIAKVDEAKRFDAYIFVFSILIFFSSLIA
jgi:hypothetical protein